MFNKSLGTASFPDSWKTARITPIFKDGEKDEMSSYSPISILPIISKLFEVFNQLYEYLNRISKYTRDNQATGSSFPQFPVCLLTLMIGTRELILGTTRFFYMEPS